MMSMNDVNVPALKDRVTKILTDPANEWRRIEPEPTTIAQLYSGYIVPLALIPAIAGLIGSVFLGGFFGGSSLTYGIVAAVLTFAMTLASVYISALVVSKLAPSFGSVSDDRQALKLVAYAYTPLWIAGVLNIIPLLGMLAILAWFYCVYLFYLGVPVMMKTPQDKVVVYMIVSAVVMILVSIVLGMISGAILAAMFLTRMAF